ncbi:MAG TPA: phospholipase D-like domain-containing protein, partial [Nannocystis sp.]
MREERGEALIAESRAATAWRRGGVIEVRPRRALPSIEAAEAAELADIWELVGRVQREHMPGGARVEFVSGAGEPVVIRLRAVAQPTELLAQRGFVPGQEIHFVEVLRAGLRTAQRIDMVAAFVMASGLGEIVHDVEDALRRGAQVRVLTGDTLEITEPAGLATLLAWMSEFERFEAKLYGCPKGQTFHAKAYIFIDADDRGVAYVGSSNLSRSALIDGIEWNLRAVEDQAELAEIRARFERLWRDERASTLTPELLDEYAARRRATRTQVPAEDRSPPPPTPHAIQAEALAALAEA